ncbi:uncharacterized protein LOC134837153 [Culicoides brevitarsis]|uniref:uncharacterized protein LOC134837153 n=1 Tax=Culicoides brevitarsis TaxID=469753 RepID=UPI00307C1642
MLILFPRESYRDSVAKSIRENFNRQKLAQGQETVIYYGNDRPQYRPQPFVARRILDRPLEDAIPRIRVPIAVKRRPLIQLTTTTTTEAPVYQEEIQNTDYEAEEEITTTTTTTEAPQAPRRQLQSRVNFEQTPVRRVLKNPHTPIIPDTPQVLSNNLENRRRYFDDEEEDQARSAHYQFSSSVQDTINDNSMTRSETREGTALTGMFSYSDGFFRRTVHYRADENGYRVTKEEIQPINNGDGPQYNPEGKADVTSSLAGSYSITADDIRKPLREEKQRRRL